MRNKVLYMWKWKVGAVLLVIILLVLCNISYIFIFSTDAACNIGLERKRQFVEGDHSNLGGNITTNNLWNMKIAMEDMAIHNETLIVTDRNCNEVVAFDLRSGRTRWTQGFGGPKELELNTDREQVYVTGGWSWQRELIAIDLNTGQRKWLNNSQNFKRIGLDVVALSTGRVLVYLGDQGPRFVDPATGEFSEIISTPLNASFKRDGDFLWLGDGSRLHAVDLVSQETVWSSVQIDVANGELANIRQFSNVVVAQFTIMNNDSPRASSQKLMGFDYDDGALLWTVANLTPGFKLEVSGEQTYICDGNKLLLFNSMNGDEVGYVVITSKDKIKSSDIENILFQVQGNIIVIYFGDTEILSIYELEK